MKCKQCGLQIDTGEKNCANCGTMVPQVLHPLTIVAFAVSLFSLAYNPFGIVSVIAVVLAVFARKKTDGVTYIGKGLANAAIVIAVISLIWLIGCYILDNYVFVKENIQERSQ